MRKEEENNAGVERRSWITDRPDGRMDRGLVFGCDQSEYTEEGGTPAKFSFP